MNEINQPSNFTPFKNHREESFIQKQIEIWNPEEIGCLEHARAALKRRDSPNKVHLENPECLLTFMLQPMSNCALLTAQIDNNVYSFLPCFWLIFKFLQNFWIFLKVWVCLRTSAFSVNFTGGCEATHKRVSKGSSGFSRVFSWFPMGTHIVNAKQDWKF